MRRPDGNFIRHINCPKCGSSDANAVYDNETTYCFSCRKPGFTDGAQVEDEHQDDKPTNFIPITVEEISNRKLREPVCQKYGYGIGEYQGAKCHVAPYRDTSGRLVAQKVRRAGKKFTVIGDGKNLPFFGQHLFNGGKSVVITEGEIDALSVASAFGDGKWPVVSLPNGAQSAAKVIAAQSEWLDGFEKIVLCFDQDEPGRIAAQEACERLPPGKAYVMTIGEYKDANEALIAEGVKVISDAFWNAKPWRPDGIVSLSDLREEAKKPIQWGLPWCFDTMTQGTFGRRDGEVYTFGAGTGVGKTDIFTQQIAYDVMELEKPVGVFFLEQQNIETVRRLAGKLAGKAFHVPDAGWTQEEYEAAVDALCDADRVFLYNHFGQSNWTIIKSRIRHLRQRHGVKLFFVDHLTALADPENERASLETIMAELAGLSQELGLIIHLVSHLSTPDGKPHEEGGRVFLRHFKGSRAIGFWTFFAFGLERDKNHEDPELRNVTTVRCLKDRYTGRFDGHTFHLKYDTNTCRLEETAAEFLKEIAEEDMAF